MKDGKVYTPESVVNFMLSDLNINKDSLILEPSCGMGALLQKLNVLSDKVDAFDIDELAIEQDKKTFTNVNCKLQDFLQMDSVKIPSL